MTFWKTYGIGRKWHRMETVGRRWLSEMERYTGCSGLWEEEEGAVKGNEEEKGGGGDVGGEGE
jgi:hypothetical protein